MPSKLLAEINRMILIARQKKPFHDWLKRCDQKIGQKFTLTLEDVRQQPFVCLIPENEELEEAIDNFLEEHGAVFLCSNLEDWITDDSFWPDPNTIDLKEWFDFEILEVVHDSSKLKI